MNEIIRLHDRPLRVRMSKRAQRQLSRRQQPLLAEIDLIFGCMVAKRVWFRETPVADAVPVSDRLQVCFRSVRYAKTCSLQAIDNGAESEAFPMKADKKHYVPDWLEIDFRKGEWKGEYGYDRAIAQENLQLDLGKPLVAGP